jgi:hypothetical protein
MLATTTKAHAPPRRIEKLAIVGPTFFSYVQAVAAEFARRGIEIGEFDEKQSNRKRAKIIYRLGLGFSVLSSQPRYLMELADRIIAGQFTDVLLVSVEVINRAFVAKLVESGLRVHLYMWDSRANKGRYQEYLDLLTSAGTFDVKDAHDLGMAYAPLFAESLFAPPEGTPSEPQFDICFCGTVHSDRVALIARLVTAPWARHLRLGLMLYYHSRSLFLMKAVAQPTALRLFSRVSGRSFPKEDVARLFASSRYVLDIAHPGQTGLTARTFEALLSGSRLLTFNSAAVRELPPALAERVTVLQRIDELAALDPAGTPPLPPLSEEERYYLSLERFVDAVLDQMENQTRQSRGELDRAAPIG